MFVVTVWNVSIQTSLLGFSIYKGCQWKNCNRATKESIIYQKWMRDSAPSAPSARVPSSLLQHWLKCCVHLHLERHIKFAPMSNLVVLGWAHEKSGFWVGHYHKLTFTLSLDGRSLHWPYFIMLFMVPEHYVGPVRNNHTHIPSTILKWGENS